MKKICMILLLSIIAAPLFAQQNKSEAAVKDFIKSFNAMDFDAIYDSFAPVFKQRVAKEMGTALVAQVYYAAGRVGNYSFVSFKSEQYSYVLEGDKSNIALQFALVGDKLDNVRLLPAKKQDTPVPNAVRLPSNNKQVSAFDKSVDQKLQQFNLQQPLTGLVLAALSDNAVTYYSYGAASNAGSPLPNENSLFDIGSISKTFTSYILASLILENKLTLDTRIDKYIAGLPARIGAISLRQLANHTSGLPGMGSVPANGVAGRDPFEQYSGEMLGADLKKIQLTSEPGLKFSYSNLGFATLGVILEKASGMAYPVLLDKYILKPLQLNATFYKKPAAYTSLTSGHDRAGAPKDYVNLGAFGPAGTIKSTAADLMKYARFMMGNDKAAVLTRDITFQNKSDKIGISWIVIPVNGQEFFFHNGATIGYTSYIAFHPYAKKAFIILNNSATDITNLGMQLMSQLLEM